MTKNTFLNGQPKQRQRGAVAIMFGLTLVVLIGFAGLAVDLGRFFVIKTELQNAMDSCALAAASQLRPGQNNPNALTRSIAYGRVFSTGGDGNINSIKNRANFQSVVVNIAANQITFSPTLNGTYLSAAAGAGYNTAAYAKCTYPLAGLPIFFMKVLNPLLTTQTVTAMAAATLAPSSSSCAIPVGVCKISNGTNFGFSTGDWIPTDEKYGTGNFGWIDFTPPGGGAKELGDILQSSGYCSAQIGDKVGAQGEKVSDWASWNSRFGLYKGSVKLADAPPDVTGYAYTNATKNPDTTVTWVLGRNAYAGSSTTGSLAPSYNYPNASANFRPYQFSPDLTSAQHQSLGRNKRVTVAPIVDCSVWAGTPGSAQPAIEGWACVLMLNPVLKANKETAMLEFLGLSTTPGNPCSTNGEPGTFGPLVPQLVQ